MRKIFLIKYGEIAIKGKNRYIFIDKLMQVIRGKISRHGNFKLYKEQGRIVVIPLDENVDYYTISKDIAEVFGIVAVGIAYVFSKSNIDKLKTDLDLYLQEEFTDFNDTFKIETKRADKKFPLNSMQISAELGGIVLARFKEARVQLTRPEKQINVEIRDEVYIYTDMLKGLGGLPVGSSGKAMLLLSGGIDSPVAGYRIAKRGVELSAVYFHSPPYTTEKAKEKVIDLARLISRFSGSFKLYIVPFTEIQMEIYEKCPHDELTIIMRRIMMKMAEELAKKEGAKALVTGESIGQVASQTMESLSVTNAAVEMPVFRPLIGYDKAEIIKISEDIGTFETSILPYEDCCTIFVAKHPVTRPKLKYIEASEKRLVNLDQMINKSLANLEIKKIGF